MAALYAKGKLGLNEDFHHEGILGTIFTGPLVEETKIGPSCRRSAAAPGSPGSRTTSSRTTTPSPRDTSSAIFGRNILASSKEKGRFYSLDFIFGLEYNFSKEEG
jgi:hypothetical protein